MSVENRLVTLFENIEMLQRTHSIYEGNLSELMDASKVGTTPDGRDVIITEVEVVRRLHNFVATAKTLIDHERRVYQKNLITEAEFQGHKAMIQEYFADDPLSDFITNLRNYCLHRSLPQINLEFIHFHNQSAAINFFLDRARLLEWDKWPQRSRRYIEENVDCGELTQGIDLFNAVKEYSAKLDKFYRWFYSATSSMLHRIEKKLNH